MASQSRNIWSHFTCDMMLPLWSVAKCGYDTLAKRANRKCQFIVYSLTLRAKLAGLGVRMSLLTLWRHKAFTVISHGRTLDFNIHWEAEMLLCLIKVVGYCGTSLAIAQQARRTQEFTIRCKVQMLMSSTGQKVIFICRKTGKNITSQYLSTVCII